MYSVSIIVPIYNVSNYVKESLLSVLNQTWGSIEYILVNDYSLDDSMDIVYELISSHPRRQDIYIYQHNENKGLSAARNTGLGKATGDFVFFMDSDDEITPDCIEKHYNAIVKENADFTVSNTKLIGAKSIHIKDISESLMGESPFLSFLKKEWSVSAWNKLYSRKFLLDNKLLFKNRLIHEDVLWSYQVACKANKLAIVTEATYIYKIREDSITTKKNSNHKIDSLLFILRYMEQDLPTHSLNKEYLQAFYHMFDFWRLNTALLLLNYDGVSDVAKEYYQQIKLLKHKKFQNLYSMILSLPFGAFKRIGLISYKIYKKINTN